MDWGSKPRPCIATDASTRQPLSAACSSTALSKKEDARAPASASPRKANLNAPPTRRLLRIAGRTCLGHRRNPMSVETSRLHQSSRPLSERRAGGAVPSPWPKKGSNNSSGLMDSFACAVSLSPQHAAPLPRLPAKPAYTCFEPSAGSGTENRIRRNRSWTTFSAGSNCVPDRRATDVVETLQELITPALRTTDNGRHGRRWNHQLTFPGESPTTNGERRVPSMPPTPWPAQNRPGRCPELQLLRQHHDQQRGNRYICGSCADTRRAWS